MRCSYGMPGYKIASADLTNHDLLSHVAGFGAAMIVSTGMSSEQEITAAVDVLRGQGAPFALLQTPSTYPAPYKDLNLRYMDRLAELGDCLVGYSGHERGWHVPVAAVARGAHIIEKHVTLDKTLEGTDHKVSLLPEELTAMVRQIREVEEALGSDKPREVSTGELMNRVNLAKSLVAGATSAPATWSPRRTSRSRAPAAACSPTAARLCSAPPCIATFPPGTSSTPVTSPGAPRPAATTASTAPGACRCASTTSGHCWRCPSRTSSSSTRAGRTWTSSSANSSSRGRSCRSSSPCTPRDLYPGDFLIDLASPDEAIWERSIHEVQRVIDMTRDMREHFTCEEDPIVVVTMGGFLPDRHLRAEERYPLYERVQQGLERIDEAGVRLTPQTVPPFPWLMGGQQFHNLFVEPEDTVWFCETYDRRLTFDVSHSKLAANFYHRPFSEYIDAMGPYTEHLHIVDSVGVDGEGVQVGEGEVDFKDLAERMDRFAPDAPFIPEIWMGHVNNGEGFFTALDRLREWF